MNEYKPFRYSLKMRNMQAIELAVQPSMTNYILETESSVGEYKMSVYKNEVLNSMLTIISKRGI